MARLILEHISKRFPGGVQAVDDVSLAIEEGEFMVLVGPSGCGKSTTLRLIAGLETLDSGTITIGDRIVNRLHPKDRDIAMVFQNYALYPHMTAYRNMAFGLRLRRMPKDEIDQRVREAAAILGITGLLARRPRALSGGQKQRVAVGRAIVRDPACFLFDEPLSNLDVKLRVQMRAEIKSLHQRLRTTTVYVTHDQEEAMTLGDRVAVMADGRILQVGEPLEVYKRPANRFVAGFVGMPPMNFIDGIVERRGEDVFFSDDPGDVRVLLSRGIAAALQSRAASDAVLGIRPEGLRLAQAPQGAHLRARIEVIEPLGDRIDVFARAARGDRIVARIDADAAVKPGATVTFTIRDDAMHLFESGAFGARIHAERAPS